MYILMSKEDIEELTNWDMSDYANEPFEFEIINGTLQYSNDFETLRFDIGDTDLISDKFNHDNTNGEYTDDQLELMNQSIGICENVGYDDENTIKHISDELLTNWYD